MLGNEQNGAPSCVSSELLELPQGPSTHGPGLNAHHETPRPGPSFKWAIDSPSHRKALWRSSRSPAERRHRESHSPGRQIAARDPILARLCFKLSIGLAITGHNISGLRTAPAPPFPAYHFWRFRPAGSRWRATIGVQFWIVRPSRRCYFFPAMWSEILVRIAIICVGLTPVVALAVLTFWK